MDLNIVSDIAGQFNTFLALIKQMPDCKVLAVGDLCDRGLRSKEVIEWFMSHPEHTAIFGNHEHLMLNECRGSRLYESGLWLYNGGGATLKSFGVKRPSEMPKDVLAWIDTLPLYFEQDGLFVAHSFVCPGFTFEQVCRVDSLDNQNYNLIWSREYPERVAGKYQVAGHNSQWGLRRFNDDQGEFALGIDTSHDRILTGLHWPSRTIYQQPYID